MPGLRKSLERIERAGAALKSAQLSPPILVDHFVLNSLIGRGGMGFVFEGEDQRLNRPVAIKAIRPLIADEKSRERFGREALALASVRHPNVVIIHHVGENEDIPYLAMELLQGQTLEARMQTSSVSIRDSLRIGAELLNGLQAVHEAGLVHRDLKPSNIWLDAADETVKLLDFGVAKSQNSRSKLTLSTEWIGTPSYMSPEQVKGKPATVRTDLYAMGLVLYELIGGRSPHQSSSVAAHMATLVSKPVPSIRSLVPELSPKLVELIDKLLERDPKSRPTSAADARKTILQVQAELDSAASVSAEPTKQFPIWKTLSAAAVALVCLPFVFRAFSEPVVPVMEPSVTALKPLPTELDIPSPAKYETRSVEVTTGRGDGTDALQTWNPETLTSKEPYNERTSYLTIENRDNLNWTRTLAILHFDMKGIKVDVRAVRHASVGLTIRSGVSMGGKQQVRLWSVSSESLAKEWNKRSDWLPAFREIDPWAKSPKVSLLDEITVDNVGYRLNGVASGVVFAGPTLTEHLRNLDQSNCTLVVSLVDRSDGVFQFESSRGEDPIRAPRLTLNVMTKNQSP